jgi:Flp pilus assembly pilin Flp
MKNMQLKKLARDQRGLSTMEYAVLFVIIIVGALALWTRLGKSLADQGDQRDQRDQRDQGEQTSGNSLGPAHAEGKTQP